MKRVEWKMKRNTVIKIILGLVAVVISLPVYLLLTGSLQSNVELTQSLRPVLSDAAGMAGFHLLPNHPTLRGYVELFFDKPEFYMAFFNTMKIVLLTLAGQLLIGVPAAWAFAAFTFRGRKLLFTLYIILMLLPFQVTMLSSYLVLQKISLTNTHWAVILPGICSTFPVFLMYRSFCAIPKGLLEAAVIDGAGEVQIFFRIGIPLGSGGILSCFILGFLEYYSLVEQPLAFLKDKSLWTLSLYLPEIGLAQAGYAFAASMAALAPALFVFLFGQEYLEKGIISSAIKE